MKKIGVTGGTGSGKTTFALLLGEALNCPVINADTLSREASALSETIDEIRKTFGEEYINSQGQMDRKKMGALVFSDERSREKLNGIIHPMVRKRYFEHCALYEAEGESYVIYDCPLLFECSLQGDVDKSILVYTRDETRLERIIKRDNLTKDEGISRMASQMSQDDKIDLSDIVIYNDSDIEDLKKAALIVAEEITAND
ncbi:MAG: dephospho-CoA kinase [Eubacteriaceae bacterium]|nr:dephospho-CoA kinase [Eubacteriaceae bacterium]